MSNYIIHNGDLRQVGSNKHNYYAVTADGSADELKHWKYLRREKMPNGKWRYYYDKDNARLNVSKHEKKHVTGNFMGSKVDLYMVKGKQTGGDYSVTTKNVYDNFKTGYKLYIGGLPVSRVASEQISVGKQFVKDLFSGELYTGNKRKKRKKRQ